MPTRNDSLRACPFCGSADRVPFGTRGDASFERCVACRSISMQITAEEFQSRHLGGWTDDEFLERNSVVLGTNPNVRVYREIARHFAVGTPILEIGPGTGHLLAAFRQAGHSVFGVETSSSHRRFIAATWSIDTVYDSLAQIPAHSAFGGVVVINTIEHMFSPADFLRDLKPFVAPGGTIFISTANARALSATLYGTMWSMFKPIDHVSLPSAAGFRRLAERCGYSVDRIWSTEYPMETIISGVVAARDFLRESRKAKPAADAPKRSEAHDPDRGQSSRARRLLQLSRRLAFMDPTSPLISALGRGGSIKAVYRVPESSSQPHDCSHR